MRSIDLISVVFYYNLVRRIHVFCLQSIIILYSYALSKDVVSCYLNKRTDREILRIIDEEIKLYS